MAVSLAAMAAAAVLFTAIAVPLLSLLGLLHVSSPKKKLHALHGDGSQLPPSPGGLPLLGHLHLMMDALPHRALRSFAASHGPVLLLRLGGVPTVLVTSAAAAEEALKTRDIAFAGRPRMLMAERLSYNNKNVINSTYGSYWRQARRVCVLHLLSPRRVGSFRRVREEAVSELISRIRTEAQAHLAGMVNLSECLILYTNAVITRAACGEGQYWLDGDSGGGKLRQVITELMQLQVATPVQEIAPWLGWVDTLTGLEAKTKRTFEVLDALLEQVIAEHCSRQVDLDDDHRDFVDVLLDVKKKDKEAEFQLDTDNIKSIVMDMFVAGTETTYTVLEWAMAELMKHPHEMNKLQHEIRTVIADAGGASDITEDHLSAMPYLKAVVCETLRLHPPGPLLVPHETTEDTELQGYHIPVGTRVLINVWAIGRDPTTWERAEEFVPERFIVANSLDYTKLGHDFRFLPFGAGRRGCPGPAFAAPSLELALAKMLYHFDWKPWNSTSPGKLSSVDMTELFGISVRMKAPLLVLPKPIIP